MARLTFIGYRPRVLPRFWQYGLSDQKGYKIYMESNQPNQNYHEEENKKNILRMREVLATLPPFCKRFF